MKVKVELLFHLLKISQQSYLSKGDIFKVFFFLLQKWCSSSWCQHKVVEKMSNWELRIEMKFTQWHCWFFKHVILILINAVATSWDVLFVQLCFQLLPMIRCTRNCIYIVLWGIEYSLNLSVIIEHTPGVRHFSMYGGKKDEQEMVPSPRKLIVLW